MTEHPAFDRLSAALGFVQRGWAGLAHPHRNLAGQEAAADVLTGLANRRRFLAAADQAIGAAARGSGACGLLVIDLDGFRAVNERYGHAAGDAVLVAVAQRLGQALPTEHLAGRLGGDGFAVLLGPDEDLKIEYCAEQVAARIARPIAFAGREIRVGASIGIATSPDDGSSAGALIAAADQRMALRKRRGRRLEAAAAA